VPVFTDFIYERGIIKIEDAAMRQIIERDGIIAGSCRFFTEDFKIVPDLVGTPGIQSVALFEMNKRGFRPVDNLLIVAPEKRRNAIY
jgi:hypothetical protein